MLSVSNATKKAIARSARRSEKEEAREDRAYGNGMLAALKFAESGSFEDARKVAELKITEANRVLGES